MMIPPHVSPGAAERAAAVTTVLDAIVFREILKPLAAALGSLGDVVADRIAERAVTRPKA